MRIDYMARETLRNLRRNLTLTLASILTVAVSLSLLGIALLLQRGVSNATDRWQDGVEFIVFLEPEITTNQLGLVQGEIERSAAIESYRYVDQEESYREFNEDFFPENPEITQLVTKEIIPPSYRIIPKQLSAEAIEIVASGFETKPGVKKVVRATDEIQKIEKATDVIRWIVLGAGAILLGTGLLLILNTIRMAIFARRREIEVMKLVGASNSFILVPFMLEGTFQGLVGAALGTASVYGANRAFEEWLASDNVLNILQSFAVGAGDVWAIGGLLLLVGALVGSVGSAIAAYRFLDA
ncbi:MAG: permease-like cell division protein FtsX [Acidimicrobiales bacterium]|nr:permease-like cell division protein FtsX [Acidimicrobiales bacterium]